MSSEVNLERVSKEIYQLKNIVHECTEILKSKSRYSQMSLEELSSFYDRIENGLISYNFLVRNTPFEFKDISTAISIENERAGKFLEAQILNVVVTMINKNDYHLIPNKFKESLWYLKMKNKEYYDQVFELAVIENEYRDALYNYLQVQKCSY